MVVKSVYHVVVLDVVNKLNNMNFTEYQERAVSTAVYKSKYKVMYPSLGLAGEAGEVADKVKKIYRDFDGEFSSDKRIEIAKEIGDVLWYCATLANDLEFDLDLIAQMNIDKLSSRKDRDVLHGSGDNR